MEFFWFYFLGTLKILKSEGHIKEKNEKEKENCEVDFTISKTSSAAAKIVASMRVHTCCFGRHIY